MNKVFIRTRQIDNNKQLPILLRENDDLTDFNEYSNISKSSQILSGMDKGEESEHHLQEVLRELQYDKAVFNKAIPIPEVTEEPTYELMYKTDFKLPKHYIRLKTLDFEDELPEYDLDEEDKEWLENSKLNVSSLKFEQIIEQFERACCQKALLLDEAKSLLRHEAIHLVIAIYDYWLTKRVNTGQTLILSVKSEKAERCNNTPIDPYIAFRKRSEKMTTRKNRRVDETSYEKMFRLRCQMEKLSEIIQLVSRREATKSQITQNERDLFVKRYEARDYDKLQLRESEITIKRQSIKLGENFKSAQRSREENQKETKRKRSYSKCFETNQSSAEQNQSSEDIDFTFRPMSKCKYLPSRFTLDENSTGVGLGDSTGNTHLLSETVVSGQPSSSFSLSNLSYLPEPLKKLNVPVRFRLTSNRMVSIDFQGDALRNADGAPDQDTDTVTAGTSHYRLQSSVAAPSYQSYESVDNRPCNRLSGPWVPSSESLRNPMIRRLWSLYTCYVHCGLPPMDFQPVDSCANKSNRHISSRSRPGPDGGAPVTDATVGTYCSPDPKHPPPPPLSMIGTEPDSHQHNNGHHNGIKPLSERRKYNHTRTSGVCEMSSNYHSNAFMTEYQSSKSTSFIVSPPDTNSTVVTKQSSVSHSTNNLSQLTSHSKGGGDGGDSNTAIFTYQNSLSSLSPRIGNSNIHHSQQYLHPKPGDQNRAFTTGEPRNRPILNGQNRITTATITELVESRSSNHGLNGGFKSKVGLNCLKSLTNKRAMIPPKDPGDEVMTDFYSKSTNGHHRNHHHNNITASMKINSKNHNNNNHHLSLSHHNNSNHNHHSHGWLGQSNASDSCLIPNLVVPLWKSEQPSHVMTSVNKMT